MNEVALLGDRITRRCCLSHTRVSARPFRVANESHTFSSGVGEAMSQRRRGFTLIELLVVIAIIAVLIALLVAGRAGRPGSRAARSVHATISNNLGWRSRTTSRRPTSSRAASSSIATVTPPCTSPGFGNSCQNTPWFLLMLPYIEQGQLYNAFNASIGMEGPQSRALPGGFIINSTVLRPRSRRSSARVIISSTYTLADDIPATRGRPPRGTTASTGETWMTARESSVVSSRAYPQLWLAVSVRLQLGRERARSTAESPRSPTGLSNTHFVSEILQGAHDDIRGTIWVDNAGAGSYMTRFTPNGYKDYIRLDSTVVGDRRCAGRHQLRQYRVLHCGGPAAGTSPASPATSLCDSQPGQQLGCYNQRLARGANSRGREAGIPAGSTRSSEMVRSIS